jgi:phosphoribosyl 1,2-cyclic phosphodiesterase
MVFAVQFWGVRGSIACPSPRHVAYGGNTSCLEVSAGDETIIMDAGTGSEISENLSTSGTCAARIFF